MKKKLKIENRRKKKNNKKEKINWNPQPTTDTLTGGPSDDVPGSSKFRELSILIEDDFRDIINSCCAYVLTFSQIYLKHFKV